MDHPDSQKPIRKTKGCYESRCRHIHQVGLNAGDHTGKPTFRIMYFSIRSFTYRECLILFQSKNRHSIVNGQEIING